MRCPKCGYNQFDNPDTCSKCRTDLSEERIRLNLPEGPLNPLSLTEILKMVQTGLPKDNQPVETTKKINPAPKSVALDLGDGATVAALSEKWKVNPAEEKKKNSEGFSVDLTLE
jgi:hypothetical protein